MREAWIFDLDGTLVDVSSVRHWVRTDPKNRNFERFHCDATFCPPIPAVLEAYEEAGRRGIARIVTTATQARYFTPRLWWFLVNDVPVPDDMFMRRWNDCRPDPVIKAELFDTVIRHRYNVTRAFDDNPHVAQVWRDRGIETVLIPGWNEA